MEAIPKSVPKLSEISSRNQATSSLWEIRRLVRQTTQSARRSQSLVQSKVSAYRLIGRRGELKDLVFVEYSTIEEATAAIKGMTGQYVDARPIHLDFTTRRAGGGSRGDNRWFGGGDRGGRGGRGGRGDRGGGGSRGGGRGGFRGGPPKTEFKGNKITF